MKLAVMLISRLLIFVMETPSGRLYQKAVFYTRDQSFGICFYLLLFFYQCIIFVGSFRELLFFSMWKTRKLNNTVGSWGSLGHIPYCTNTNLKQWWKALCEGIDSDKKNTTVSSLCVLALVWRALIISQMTLQQLSLILQLLLKPGAVPLLLNGHCFDREKC